MSRGRQPPYPDSSFFLRVLGCELGLDDAELEGRPEQSLRFRVKDRIREVMGRLRKLEANEQRALALLDAFESGPQPFPLQFITQAVRRVPKLDSPHDYELGENEVLGMVFDHDDGTVSLNISIIPDEAVGGSTKVEAVPESYLERQLRLQSERELLVIAVDHTGEPEGLAPGMYQDVKGNIVISGTLGGTISPPDGASISISSVTGSGLSIPHAGTVDLVGDTVSAPSNDELTMEVTYGDGERKELGVGTWVSFRALVEVHEHKVRVSVRPKEVSAAWFAHGSLLRVGVYQTCCGVVIIDEQGNLQGPLAPEAPSDTVTHYRPGYLDGVAEETGRQAARAMVESAAETTLAREIAMDHLEDVASLSGAKVLDAGGYVTQLGTIEISKDGAVRISTRQKDVDRMMTGARLIHPGFYVTPQGPVSVGLGGRITGPLAPKGHQDFTFHSRPPK